MFSFRIQYGSFMTDRKNRRLYEHFGQTMLLRIGLCRLKKKSPPVRPSGKARLKMMVSFFIGLSQGRLDGPAGCAFFGSMPLFGTAVISPWRVVSPCRG
jgi:hypothetical protein